MSLSRPPFPAFEFRFSSHSLLQEIHRRDLSFPLSLRSTDGLQKRREKEREKGMEIYVQYCTICSIYVRTTVL